MSKTISHWTNFVDAQGNSLRKNLITNIRPPEINGKLNPLIINMIYDPSEWKNCSINTFELEKCVTFLYGHLLSFKFEKSTSIDCNFGGQPLFIESLTAAGTYKYQVNQAIIMSNVTSAAKVGGIAMKDSEIHDNFIQILINYRVSLVQTPVLCCYIPAVKTISHNYQNKFECLLITK